MNTNAKRHLSLCCPEIPLNAEKRNELALQIRNNRFYVRNDKLETIGLENEEDKLLLRFLLLILGGIIIDESWQAISFCKFLKK